MSLATRGSITHLGMRCDSASIFGRLVASLVGDLSLLGEVRGSSSLHGSSRFLWYQPMAALAQIKVSVRYQRLLVCARVCLRSFIARCPIESARLTALSGCGPRSHQHSRIVIPGYARSQRSSEVLALGWSSLLWRQLLSDSRTWRVNCTSRALLTWSRWWSLPHGGWIEGFGTMRDEAESLRRKKEETKEAIHLSAIAEVQKILSQLLGMIWRDRQALSLSHCQQLASKLG